MDTLFSTLYPLVAICAFSGFVPQILKLFKTQSRSENMSISTWSIWCLCWIVSLGYGFFCLNDLLFCLTSGMNVCAHFAIIALLFHNRYIRFPVKARLIRQSIADTVL